MVDSFVARPIFHLSSPNYGPSAAQAPSRFAGSHPGRRHTTGHRRSGVTFEVLATDSSSFLSFTISLKFYVFLVPWRVLDNRHLRSDKRRVGSDDAVLLAQFQYCCPVFFFYDSHPSSLTHANLPWFQNHPNRQRIR